MRIRFPGARRGCFIPVDTHFFVRGKVLRYPPGSSILTLSFPLSAHFSQLASRRRVASFYPRPPPRRASTTKYKLRMSLPTERCNLESSIFFIGNWKTGNGSALSSDRALCNGRLAPSLEPLDSGTDGRDGNTNFIY